MASPPRKKSPSTSSWADRISELPDRVLGHVLSFLPTKEAGRAATLGRRWRDIFCSVHTVSFEEVEGEREDDWDTFYYEAVEQRSCSVALLDCISAVLLRRRRQCGDGGFTTMPLRSLRFAFDSYHGWDKVAVDQWLSDVLRRGGNEELHLDMCFSIGPICARRKDDDDERETNDDNEGWVYVLPSTIFSCTAIGTLCLSHCKLNLPETIDLPFLKTLRLTGIRGSDSEETIQRLVWSCPRLIDLTLEANNRLKRITILDKLLRRLALRCCHNMTKVIIDASELRSLEYRGAVPVESLMSLGVSPRLDSCTIGFCRVRPKESEFVCFRRFLEKVSDSKHLHLHHRGLVDGGFFAAFPLFSGLKRLELQGPIESNDTINTIRRILEQTPNLKVLSLYMEIDTETMVHRRSDLREVLDDDEEEYERSLVLDNLRVADESSFSMPCLRHRVKEISMVNYQRDVQQRTLARLLFRNALVLEMMCVVFVRGSFPLQYELKKEIESWLVAKPEKSFM